jgi:trk system potassium uptake protein
VRLVIAGVGRLTYFLARALEARGHEVVIVGTDRAICERLARRLKATVVVGDPTTPEPLEEAGAGSADQLLAVTWSDHENLVTCQLARLRFQVPRILAIVNDPDSEEVFRALGVEVAFSPIRVLASLIEQRADLDAVISLAPAAGGKVLLADVRLDPGAAAVGKSLRELRLPQGALVGCVVRGEEAFVPHGETDLRAGDRVLVLGTKDVHERAVRVLTATTK